MSRNILVVDDEKNIVDILSFNLEREGYTVSCAYDGREGLRLARETAPDLILLDVMLPYMDGFEVCRTLRDEGSNIPIIMITAREGETDKVLGLELGADDYITKPFSVRELLARVKANMRRTVSPESMPPKSGQGAQTEKGITFDLDRHAVFKDGREVELTQREYELIKFLAATPGKVISRQELMTEVWQYDYYGDLRAVDVAVRRLREKIEDNPAEPCWVMTKRGVGYYYQEQGK